MILLRGRGLFVGTVIAAAILHGLPALALGQDAPPPAGAAQPSSPTPAPTRRALLPPPQVTPETDLSETVINMAPRLPAPAPVKTPALAKAAQQPIATPTPAPSPKPERTDAPIQPAPAITSVVPLPPAFAAASLNQADPITEPTGTVTRVPLAPTPPQGERQWIMIAGLVLIAGGLGVLLFTGVSALARRRAMTPAGGRAGARRDQEAVIDFPPSIPSPLLTPVPALAPAPAPIPPAAPVPRVTAPVLRPWLEIDFTPFRAGRNLTGAAVEFELAVRNIGSIAASDVRIMVQLLTANPQQNAQIAAAFGVPTDKPVIAPFPLDPGDLASIKAVGTLALDKISRVDLQGRPMFVPILAVRAVYGWEGERGQGGSTANAYILGIGHQGQNKMQPFWLDHEPRMAERITYRLHDMGIRR